MSNLKQFTSRTLLLTLGVALTLASGLLHGQLRQRWGQNARLLAEARDLAQLPLALPGWRFQEARDMSPEALEMLQCPGYIQRVYVNESTGQAVNLAVLVGPAGPMAVHTPEICYSSREYSILQSRQRAVFPAGPSQDDELWTLTLGSPGVHGGQVRVYYGWSDGGAWLAPEQPRFSLAGRPYLYKLQLATILPRHGQSDGGNDPCAQLLEEFLPVFRQHLFTLHSHRPFTKEAQL